MNSESNPRNKNSAKTVTSSKKRSRSDSFDLSPARNVSSKPRGVSFSVGLALATATPNETPIQRINRTSEQDTEWRKKSYDPDPADPTECRPPVLDITTGKCAFCGTRTTYDAGFYTCNNKKCGAQQNYRPLPPPYGGAHYINGQHTSEFTQNTRLQGSPHWSTRVPEKYRRAQRYAEMGVGKYTRY